MHTNVVGWASLRVKEMGSGGTKPGEQGSLDEDQNHQPKDYTVP